MWIKFVLFTTFENIRPARTPAGRAPGASLGACRACRRERQFNQHDDVLLLIQTDREGMPAKSPLARARSPGIGRRQRLRAGGARRGVERLPR